MEELKVGDSVVLKNSCMAERVFLTGIERTFFGKRYSIAYQLPDKKLNCLSGFKRESLIKRG